MTWFQGLRMMFYFITPNESSFATPEEVPDYIDKVGTHAATCTYRCTLWWWFSAFSKDLLESEGVLSYFVVAGIVACHDKLN